MLKRILAFDEMMSIQKHYKSALNSIEQMTLEGQGQTINGGWYLIIPEEERINAQNELKQHLEIE